MHVFVCLVDLLFVSVLYVCMLVLVYLPVDVSL